MIAFATGAGGVARVEVRCGSGTYLRSIARDLGGRLGVGGFLGRLVRTAYGPLEIGSAVQLSALETAQDGQSRPLPADVILPRLQRVKLTPEQGAIVRPGPARL